MARRQSDVLQHAIVLDSDEMGIKNMKIHRFAPSKLLNPSSRPCYHPLSHQLG